jgi:hypothetical protein
VLQSLCLFQPGGAVRQFRIFQPGRLPLLEKRMGRACGDRPLLSGIGRANANFVILGVAGG